MRNLNQDSNIKVCVLRMMNDVNYAEKNRIFKTQLTCDCGFLFQKFIVPQKSSYLMTAKERCKGKVS